VKKLELSLPALIFIAATRAALGAGVGLLAADRLRRRKRRRIALTLLALGVLTTIPAAFMMSGRGGTAKTKTTAAAS
jgi:hypothetical protein